MALYVLIGRDGARGVELRKLHREAHLRKLGPLAESGRLVFAGPLLDEAGAPCGTVAIFDAADLASARDFAAADPYVVEGVFATWEVFETRKVLPD